MAGHLMALTSNAVSSGSLICIHLKGIYLNDIHLNVIVLIGKESFQRIALMSIVWRKKRAAGLEHLQGLHRVTL